MMKYLLIYLVAMNVITFAVYGIDKMKAKRADNAELINSFAADDHATNY